MAVLEQEQCLGTHVYYIVYVIYIHIYIYIYIYTYIYIMYICMHVMRILLARVVNAPEG